jgi:hypothetical protein
MWTLVLVIFLVSGTSNGGVSTATSFLDFPNEAKCRAAADAIAVTQQLTLFCRPGRVLLCLRRPSIASVLNALNAHAEHNEIFNQRGV